MYRFIHQGNKKAPQYAFSLFAMQTAVESLTANAIGYIRTLTIYTEIPTRVKAS